MKNGVHMSRLKVGVLAYLMRYGDMPVRTSKYSRSARIQPGIISQTKACLQELPTKKEELFSLREAIRQLRAPLKAALTKGYSYQELAAMLQQQEISISASTLRTYLASGKQNSGITVSSHLRHKTSKNSPEKLNSSVEVFLPSKTEMFSYTVRRDFWNAYQESLREREEVYRRLAES
jgi:transposase